MNRLLAAVAGAVLAFSGVPAGAEDLPAGHAPVSLNDPLSFLDGAPDAWTVSRTDAGCFLLSPRRPNTSNLAIGRHAKSGLGLFLANFGLAVPKGAEGEPVTIRAQGGDLAKAGQVTGIQLLFIPLEAAEVETGLRELTENGALWLMIRRVWIGHAGSKVAQAVAEYRQDCAAAPPARAKGQ